MKKRYIKPKLYQYADCEFCICCGAPIPEGRLVCPFCENGDIY